MRSTVVALLVVVSSAAGVVPVQAQDADGRGPPAVGTPRTFELPPLTRTRLANGARLLVVPNRESPLVSIEVILPGGQATDPDGLEGVALMTAALLRSGTTTRARAEIVQDLERTGATFDAVADADWTRISLVALEDQLDPALDVLADMLSDPVFPEARVRTLRRQAGAALATQRSRPDALARRVMLREVYRGHPYGKQTTEETLAAVDRDALRRHHARWYGPESALVVVAGAVDPVQVQRRLEEAFDGWDGAAAPRTDPPGIASTGRRLVLVHVPGAVEADVRIGHPLPRGDADAWLALEVAAHHLGATPTGVLHRRLHEELGWTRSATARAERRVGPGVLEVAFASRNAVVADAVGETLRLVDELRSRPMADRDMEGVSSFLAGALPLRSETPRQIAERVSSRLLLGLEPEGAAEVGGRLRALVPGDVRRAFADAVDPAGLTVVVVGDATVLYPDLSAFGDVRIERPDGTPVAPTELQPTDRSRPLSAVDLGPATLRYRVTLQGRPVGELVRDVRGRGDERTVRSRLTLGPQTLEQSVTFGAEGFDFRESSMSLDQPGVAVRGDVRREGATVVGRMDLGAGPQRVEVEVPAGVVVADMLEVAVWLADLDVGTELHLPVASMSNGTVANATLRVEERTDITVPAGTFEVFRVEVTGSEEQTMWVRTTAPHLPVRVAPGDQPIVVELVEIGEAPAGLP